MHNTSPGISLVPDTIGALVDTQAEKRPDTEAYVLPFQNIRRTFGELKKDVDMVAGGLLSLGLQRGDRVGIWVQIRTNGW